MPSKKGRRQQSKRPPSQNEQRLEMVTSRASNIFARINQEMSKGMTEFKRGLASHNANTLAQASRSVASAIDFSRQLHQTLLQVPQLMLAIQNEPLENPPAQPTVLEMM